MLFRVQTRVSETHTEDLGRGQFEKRVCNTPPRGDARAERPLPRNSPLSNPLRTIATWMTAMRHAIL